jgi:hypothetical protein
MDNPDNGELKGTLEDIQLPSEFANSGGNGSGALTKLAVDETPLGIPLESSLVAAQATHEATPNMDIDQVPPKITSANTLTVDLRQRWTLKEYPSIPLSILIMIVGSRGDVQPFVALGKMLKEKYGHR